MRKKAFKAKGNLCKIMNFPVGQYVFTNKPLPKACEQSDNDSSSSITLSNKYNGTNKISPNKKNN